MDKFQGPTLVSSHVRGYCERQQMAWEKRMKDWAQKELSSDSSSDQEFILQRTLIVVLRNCVELVTVTCFQI